MKSGNTSWIPVIKEFLRERLQTDNTTFYGHPNQWKTIHDLLRRTAEYSESNSALLIGPRGCGKTTLLSSVLSVLMPKKEFHKSTLIVYLNGLIHTDDRLALKSATVQLNLENAVDGKVFGSFAENLAFLLECLKSGNKTSKSIIFILDEFDLFCSHHNQTLLYNLFDVSQSAQAPVCVLGITCRLDVIELLEKRVKSRFSHRQVFLFPEANQFEERMKSFESFLKLPTEKELTCIEEGIPLTDFMRHSELFFLTRKFNPKRYKFPKELVELWNGHIEELSGDPIVRSVLENLYDFDITQQFFKTFLFQLVSKLNENHEDIEREDVVQLVTAYNMDDKLALLTGISVLELCLIISMKHHSEIYDRDPFNFEIIFARFQKFCKTTSIMQGIERPVALKAFEHLINMEFIALVSSSASKVQKEFQMYRLLLTNGQVNQCVSKYEALPTEVTQWAISSLI